MAFSVQHDEEGMMNEINMTPFVDVMLVLLIVFIVTIPVIKHSVNIDLPKASSEPVDSKTESITVGVHANGTYAWQDDNGQQLNLAQLHGKLAQAAQQQPLPALHIQADKSADYQHVAKLMATAAKAGISSMGFITTPDTTRAVAQAISETPHASARNTTGSVDMNTTGTDTATGSSLTQKTSGEQLQQP